MSSMELTYEQADEFCEALRKMMVGTEAQIDFALHVLHVHEARQRGPAPSAH
jgi:hypothetical protein